MKGFKCNVIISRIDCSRVMDDGSTTSSSTSSNSCSSSDSSSDSSGIACCANSSSIIFPRVVTVFSIVQVLQF